MNWFRSDVGELGPHSMLIPKIVGEDYVADNSLGCATDGRKERKIGRNLRHSVRLNWIVSEDKLLIFGVAC